MRVNIAIVGSYGSGRTTLARALAERTGLPVAYGSAMADPIGAEGKPVHDWTPGELVQLTARRYGERLLAEAAHPGGFISDGSILHEPVYAKTRLAAGSYPLGTDLSAYSRSPATAAYEDVCDHIGLLAAAHAAGAYGLYLHLPAEFPLKDAEPPVSEAFRAISETLLLDALRALGARPRTLRGTVGERVDQALSLLSGLSGSDELSTAGAGR
ncbi:ATP-binding protein [Glycomyces endophyticus]|uniref:ATP-binding protein n=1 Tax=Glycomyces endophyticus TaxID=480996 RepID=A0ABP4SNM4_9ACTN